MNSKNVVIKKLKYNSYTRQAEEYENPQADSVTAINIYLFHSEALCRDLFALSHDLKTLFIHTAVDDGRLNEDNKTTSKVHQAFFV